MLGIEDADIDIKISRRYQNILEVSGVTNIYRLEDKRITLELRCCKLHIDCIKAVFLNRDYDDLQCKTCGCDESKHIRLLAFAKPIIERKQNVVDDLK